MWIFLFVLTKNRIIVILIFHIHLTAKRFQMIKQLKDGNKIKCFVSQQSKKDANLTQYETTIVDYNKKEKLYISSNGVSWKFAVEVINEYYE